MDAKKFLEEVRRICKKQERDRECQKCQIKYKLNSCLFDNLPEEWELEEIERIIPIVEKHRAEHPKKTRRQDFLEKYPNALCDDTGMPFAIPVYLGYCEYKNCYEGCPHNKNSLRKCWEMEVEEE